MIRGIFYDHSPLLPGERRELKVQADGEVEITVYCFKRTPPPPQLVPCARIRARAGVVEVSADTAHFPPKSVGELRIEITDLSDGDMRRIRIPVEADIPSPQSSGIGA